MPLMFIDWHKDTPRWIRQNKGNKEITILVPR